MNQVHAKGGVQGTAPTAHMKNFVFKNRRFTFRLTRTHPNHAQ